MEGNKLKNALDRGVRKRLKSLGAGGGNVTNGALSFGYDEEKRSFFSEVGFAGILGRKAVGSTTKVLPVPMKEEDAVKIARHLNIEFEPGQLARLQPEAMGDSMAAVVVRDMLDVGIVCLRGSLGNNNITHDCMSGMLSASVLQDNKGLSELLAWVSHSTPLFDLLKREFPPTAFWGDDLFSFDNIGFIREIAKKPVVVRDSDALTVNDSNGISKYITIGLSRGALAANASAAKFEVQNDTCMLKWYLHVAVKGFQWRGDTGVAELEHLSSSPSSWEAKTNAAEHLAGFMVETKPPTSQAEDTVKPLSVAR